MTAVYSIVIALSLAIIFLGVLVVGLLRSHAEVLKRLDRLGVRLDDPELHQHETTLAVRALTSDSVDSGEYKDVVGTTPEGDTVSVSPGLGEDPTLLAFLSTSCSSCTNFWEGFDAPVSVIGRTRFRVAVVTLGPDEESPTRAAGLRRGSVDVLMSSQAWDDYSVPGAPYFVLVAPAGGGVIGEGTASTFAALEEFLTDAGNDQDWDRSRSRDRTDADRERMVDRDLRSAGLEPNDPRLYHSPGDIDG